MYPTGTNAYSQYRATAVQTAGPGKLLLMLYNGLILSLKQARRSIEANALPEAHRHLIKAQDIIAELMRTLNMDYEIAAGLAQLYDYFNRRLIQANIRKDPRVVEEVLSLVTELRDTWAAVIKQGGDSPAR